jgi:hypothetical protein
LPWPRSPRALFEPGVQDQRTSIQAAEAGPEIVQAIREAEGSCRSANTYSSHLCRLIPGIPALPPAPNAHWYADTTGIKCWSSV